MGTINIIAMNQLQDASSQKEALLCQAIEKFVEVEALAMQRLSEKLPPEIMQNLRERILLLKDNAAKSYGKEEIISFSLSQILNREESNHSQASISDNRSLENLESRSKTRVAHPATEDLSHTNIDHSVNQLWARSKQSLLSRAKALLGFHSVPALHSHNYYPTISFKQRGRTAGSAYLQRWEVRLNPILLAENSELFIKEVIPHEYAHLLTFALYGRVQPHGKEWQMMMTEIMGLPANRTHCFNTDNSSTRRYERFTYTCLCQTHELTAIRHNRVQARKARYFCKHCGESLERREP